MFAAPLPAVASAMCDSVHGRLVMQGIMNAVRCRVPATQSSPLKTWGHIGPWSPRQAIRSTG